jgi:hypothetical protein
MIVIVYHAFLVNNWKEVVKEQISRVVEFGLYDSCDLFYMTVNREETPEEELIDFLKDYKKINFEFSESNLAEYLGIKKVREIGESYDDAKIFYFHTKGVSNNWKDYKSKQISHEKIENIKLWKEALEYFVIDKWRECVNLLNDYDTVGLTCNGGWYWGNFWWTKSQHVRKTKKVESWWDRWAFEAWINHGVDNPKNYEFYHIGFSVYITKLLPSLYKGELSKYKGEKLIVKKATYGTPPFEINEGYSETPLDVVNDVTEIVQKYVDDNGGTKLKFYVDSALLGGDPLWGYRKVVIVELYPESNPDDVFKFGEIEGSVIDFEF